MSPLKDHARRASRGKRRRIRERADATTSAGVEARTEVGEQQNVNGLMKELSDDVTSLILSFVVGNEAGKQELSGLFDAFAYTSKWSHNCCMEYIKRMDGVFALQFYDLEFAMWLCRHNAKVRDLRYEMKRFEDMNIVLLLLQSCNISGLEKLMLCLDRKVEEIDDYDRCVAIQKGLSHDDVRTPMTVDRFETSLVESMEGLQTLRVLHLHTYKQTLILPLLTKISDQIEQLTLDMMDADTYSSDKQKDFNKSFEETVDRMGNLTHFYWFLPFFESEIVHAFSIRSQSIQTLRLRGNMRQSQYIHACICPSLKRLTIPFYLDDMPEKLLESFSHSIEDLSLRIDNMDDQFDHETDFTSELSTLSSMIESMHHLKKLKILFCPEISSGATIGMSIKSNSLEQIDVRHSSFAFTIIECNCPMLKKLKQEYEKRYDAGVDRFHVTTNGVIPIDPVTHQFVTFGGRVVSVKVEDQMFQGMTVPDSCVIKMSMKDWFY